MSATVRTTKLEVRVNGVPDTRAVAATCAFGFDQRYAEATVRRTGGASLAIGYWDPVEIAMGCVPGEDLTLRFAGYVVPIDNRLYPVENVLHCKGRLYRAAFVKNNQVGGTDLAPPFGEPTPAEGGTTDEDQVRQVLSACGVPYDDADIEGTGMALGSVFEDLSDLTRLGPGPFTWQEQQSGLDYIEALDEVSVPDDASGRYRTFETLGGQVVRRKLATEPGAGAPGPGGADASFTEGVDVLEASISRDPGGSANRVTVTGGPLPRNLTVVGSGADVQFSAQAYFTVSSEFAPYLPPDLPPGPEGFPAVTATLSSPMIEKSTRDQTDVDGTPFPPVLSCQAVAEFLLTESNTVVDVLEFTTPRDDLLAPGWSIHLDSPRLGLTDPSRDYWLEHLEVTVDERGAFTQRLRCLRKS